jgi:NADPH:quinone reductase-like Zn-dependent oxidoreductase
VGQEFYGVSDSDFCGTYTQFAIASAKMVARKPLRLSHVEAASAPVVAVTAWQMLFDYADAKPTQRVLIHGPARNVGAYAVQLASQAGLQVFATAASEDLADVRSLGAAAVVDYKTTRFENTVPPVDAIIDTVGGNTRARSLGIIKPGGVLVTSVSESPPEQHQANGGSRVFFLVEVTTSRLDKIADLFDQSKLIARVGTVLPLEQGRIAHEMLAGAPHKRGKIVLEVGG